MPFSLSYITQYLREHVYAPTCIDCRLFIQRITIVVDEKSTICITGHCRLCGRCYTVYLTTEYSWWISDQDDMKRICDYAQGCLNHYFAATFIGRIKDNGHIE
jgi:hypothetical protein